MLTLYYAPATRSARIRWLLEELGLEHELRRVEFQRPQNATFLQKTPLGKLPVLVDGDTVICESGAILEYVLERYGDGRLAPAVGSPLRGRFLQWIHFSESTAYAPLGILIWNSLYRPGPGVERAVADARERVDAAFDFLDEQLGDDDYLLGDEFSGADVMMGFTLAAARFVGALGEGRTKLNGYLERLEARPAFQRATED